MGKKYNTYIHRLAQTIIGQINIKLDEFDDHPTQKLGAKIVYWYGKKISNCLKGMSLQTKAKIAAQGKALHASGGFSLEDVHRRSTWVNGSLSGEDIITLVATTAIIAAICDLMMDDRHERGVGGPKVKPGDGAPFGYGGPRPAISNYFPGLEGNDRRS